jgi:membrane dipeptidase
MTSIKDFLDISSDQVEHGYDLHKSSIVIDQSKAGEPTVWSEAQTDKMMELLDEGVDYVNLITGNEVIENIRLSELFTSDSWTRNKYSELLKNSGVTCISKTCGVFSIEDSIKGLSTMHLKFDKMRDLLVHARCVEDIKRAKREGKHAVILDFQNTSMISEPPFNIDQQLDRLDLFYGLGVRVIQLTYNLRNYVGDGCTERQDSGLSRFGLRVIERMNKLGILVDTGHCGMKTTIEAAEFSKAPIAATHTCCRSLYFHERGKTDEALKAVADSGGVIGIVMVPMFLGRVIQGGEKWSSGNLKDMLDHIDYAVDLVGVDHVGIGTDTADIPGQPEDERLMAGMNKMIHSFWYGFRPGPPPEGHEHGRGLHVYPPRPNSLEAWSNWPNITVGLVSRGYSDKEIEKIIGKNWLRLYERVIG